MSANGPADILIKNARFLLTMDDQRRLLEGATIAIKGDRIAAIGEDGELDGQAGPDTRIIDAGDFFVTPGLVNSHVHLESCYDKGLLDDVPVVPWCERYFSYTYGTLTDESYYWAALASLLACVKTGTTTVADCGTIQTMEASCVKAVDDIGMRAVLGRDLMDIHGATKSDYVSYDAFTDLLDRLQENTEQCLERSDKFINDYNDTADGRIRTWLDLQQVCNVSPELCTGVKKMADGYGVGVMTHAAVSHDMVEMTRKRFGMRDIEYLYHHGVLGRNFLAAHMAWTDARELIWLKETDSNVAHVPGSSLHGLYSAISSRSHIPEYVNAGINVGIGNDESSTGTCHDMMREIYLVSTVHAEARHTMLFPNRDLFQIETAEKSPVAVEMATINGAKAVNWEDDIGSLEVGKKADIAMWDLTSYEWIPTNRVNLLNNFVLNATGRSCDTVICNGKVIMEDQKVLGVDEAEIRTKCQEYYEQYYSQAGWIENKEIWELKWVRE
jgi:cytosine/adenosine deaminase-related metal-dependent hydrolase